MDDLLQLTAELRSGVPQRQAVAAERLAQLGPDAAPAAPALAQACSNSDDLVSQWAAAALEGLGPPLPAHRQELASLLSADAPTAYWAATLLGRLGPAAGPSSMALAQAAAAGPCEVRERAAWALGQIGPAAGVARETLRRVAAEEGGRLARLARLAQEAIEKMGD